MSLPSEQLSSRLERLETMRSGRPRTTLLLGESPAEEDSHPSSTVSPTRTLLSTPTLLVTLSQVSAITRIVPYILSYTPFYHLIPSSLLATCLLLSPAGAITIMSLLFSYNIFPPLLLIPDVDHTASAYPSKGFNAAGRGYPDVAALGHGYPVSLGGNFYKLDGTSASSPGAITLIAPSLSIVSSLITFLSSYTPTATPLATCLLCSPGAINLIVPSLASLKQRFFSSRRWYAGSCQQRAHSRRKVPARIRQPTGLLHRCRPRRRIQRRH